MQRLIDANALNKRLTNPYQNQTVMWEVDKEPTVLTMPDNPTNGDMIKAVFPNFEEDVTIVSDTILLERYMPYCKMQFHRDWWNAPYKEKKDADSD